MFRKALQHLRATADTEGDITIKMMSDGQTLYSQIIDTGIPFDPTKKETVDTTLSAEDRQIGGLGIHLVRSLMDTINYEREDGKNVLTLIKKTNQVSSSNKNSLL